MMERRRFLHASGITLGSFPSGISSMVEAADLAQFAGKKGGTPTELGINLALEEHQLVVDFPRTRMRCLLPM